ncbi:DUF3999 family protein [Paenibacillus sp. IHBB 10380]|uniref:DUF3999 family protein n=1 Tax=Paenibacillus sp. IHBB 10380 TaxID=1566358 RepID=UPI0005CFE351|nr:DUF3999 family protein [Paenibacillus sp. IHBB 10380]AJS60569.1 hypothetical protein UB51_21315 [Paenibacillus sp. IHBB 10380]
MLRNNLIRRVSTIAILASFVCLFTGVNVTAAEDGDGPQGWRFSKPLILQEEGSRYQTFFLDEQTYAGANSDLSDLRIVNTKGQYVPFYINSRYGESVEQEVTYRSTLVNKAKKNKNTSFDYRLIPIHDQVDIQGNILAIHLPDEVFLKHVEVYGSYDGNEWELVKKDELYRTDSLKKATIDLETAYKFSYYRLNVLNNVENLPFSQLELIHNTSDVRWNEYKKSAKPKYEIQQDAKFTHIIVHNENRLRLNKVQLQVEGNFKRSYDVYDKDGSKVRTEGEGELYRLDFKDVQIANTTIIGTVPINAPYFTITINNHDDAPLEIKGVTTEFVVDKVVFEDQGNQPYQLLYGKDNVDQPQYDIVNFKTHIQQEHVPEAKLGAQVIFLEEATPSKLPTPWWLQQRVWFNGVIMLVSVILVILLIRKMNKSSRNE